MDKQKSISVTSLVLMIIGVIFGLSNTTIAYYQMGYASIIWYIIAAIAFFLPMSLMFAEYGSTLKNSKGGIYSWLIESVGEKWAFIGTFIWISAWVIWLLNISSRTFIPLSYIFTGSDTTQSWSLFGLSGTQTVGVLAILWIIVTNFISTRGTKSITKLSSLGGLFSILLTAVFAIFSIGLIFLNHGHLAQPINGISSFVTSPNPQFQSPVAVISFIVYAVFAYGGMETLGGMTDRMKRPEKQFPKAVIIATILITIFYAVSIFLVGFSVNWQQVLGSKQVNLGNITYTLLTNLGVSFGSSLGLSHVGALTFGNVLARITGLGMLLSVTGEFFVILYSPLKSFVLGASQDIMPKRAKKLNEYGMPTFAMWTQTIIIAIAIFFISFGGTSAQQFYTILTDMTNVSTTVPYLFLSLAFPFFKRRTDLKRPFVIFHNQKLTNIISLIVFLVVAFGIIFTVIQPLLAGDIKTAFWSIIGPVLFGGIAWGYYSYARHRVPIKSSEDIDN